MLQAIWLYGYKLDDNIVGLASIRQYVSSDVARTSTVRRTISPEALGLRPRQFL
jgi:hypothetical protein